MIKRISALGSCMWEKTNSHKIGWINSDIPVKAVQDQLQCELEVQISMSKAFRAKAKSEIEIRGDHVLQYFMLKDYVVKLQSTNPNTTVKIAVERNIDPSLPTRVFQRIYICLRALKLDFKDCRRDLLGLDGAFMKGPFLGQVLVAVGLDSNNGIYPLAYALVEAKTIKTVYPSAEHRYCLRHIHENIKQEWCGQAYKDLLWRAASTTNVRDFEKCMLELKTMNPKAHEWLNKIPAEHWARSHFSSRTKSNLLLNNIYEVFNGKIVGGRDKPMITVLVPISTSLSHSNTNHQSSFDFPSPASLGHNNPGTLYTASGFIDFVDSDPCYRIENVQGVIDKCIGPLTPTATRIMESIKKEAHLIKVQWNGANKYQVSGSLGDHCVVDVVEYMEGNILSQDTTNLWDQVLGEVHMSTNNFATQASCPGGNNAEASDSASRQTQETEPVVGQDGSGADVVIGLSAAADEGGASGPGGTSVDSQGSSHSRWTKRRVQTKRISPQKRTLTQPANQPSTSSQVPVSETRNANGKEMGDGVPT
ncbi:hypothetical protein Tco_0312772 [Tanacetum coccineum]